MKPKLQILYEDAHILVCFKPHGTAVQSRRPGQPDMEHMILNHLAASRHHASPPKSARPYLAIIHRLDQPVSGILVFAKTPEDARNLNKQLTSGGFGKHYLALVDGCPEKEEDILTGFIVKDGRTNTSRICGKDTAGAKQARLSYHVLSDRKSSYGNIFPEDAWRSSKDTAHKTLLEITLDTGRHHQIRVQLAHMGCPITGDTKYNPNTDAAHNPQTLRLCAYKLTFRHPAGGKPMQFDLSSMNLSPLSI